MYKSVHINELESITPDSSTVFLDVRTPAEFAEGHIEGSINVNLMDPTFMSQISQMDKSKTYYVICRSGGRSSSACGAMANSGFENAYNAEGGMMSWMGNVLTL